MGKTEKTHVVMLLDESGSMQPYREAVVDSFNKYVTGLRAEVKRCFISLYKFDTASPLLRTLFENRKLKQCYAMTAAQYAPTGGTPLYDAVGELIQRTKKRLPKEAKVLFVIHTDGQENSSKEYNQERVRDMVRRMENKRGWTFIYLGEGAEAWNAGFDFGVQNNVRYGRSTGARGMMMDNLTMTTAYVANNAKDVTAGAHNLYEAAGAQADAFDEDDAPHVTSTIQTDSADQTADKSE